MANTPEWEAAWIIEHTYNSDGSDYFGRKLAQVAIWALFDPGPLYSTVNIANGSPSDTWPTVNKDTIQDVFAAYNTSTKQVSGSWNNVIDPGTTGGHPYQAFITPNYGPNNDVPEPATILLLGFVLVGTGRGLARRWS